MAEVAVIAAPPGWASYCTDHGVLPTLWATQLYAAWDALGHATAHHPAVTC